MVVMMRRCRQVSRSCACIGSPCLRHCVHGASVGAGRGGAAALVEAALDPWRRAGDHGRMAELVRLMELGERRGLGWAGEREQEALWGALAAGRADTLGALRTAIWRLREEGIAYTGVPREAGKDGAPVRQGTIRLDSGLTISGLELSDHALQRSSTTRHDARTPSPAGARSQANPRACAPCRGR
jgi:hypothetical protein